MYGASEDCFRNFLFAAIHTGLRPYCELARVTADDVEENGRGMMWRVYSSKTKKTRKIPVRLIITRVKADMVRRGEMRASDPEERKRLKGYRWPTLKNPWNLTRREKEKLSDLPRNNRRLYRAYILKEVFQTIFDTETPEEADRIFTEWYGWARRSQIEPMRRLAQSLKQRWQGIRRFIQLRLTNAIVEGFNSKIRMLSHRAFGYHTADALTAMIRLCCTGIQLEPLGHGR